MVITPAYMKSLDLDDRDKALLAARVAAFDPTGGPRVGDFVEFIGGVTRQISYVWPGSFQTEKAGRFYLGPGYMSFSGSLYGAVPTETLTLTDEACDAGGVVLSSRPTESSQRRVRTCSGAGVDVQRKSPSNVNHEENFS